MVCLDCTCWGAGGRMEGITFGQWAIHRIEHSQHLLGFNLIRFLHDRVGVLDTPEEGGEFFWRWDFWSSRAKRRQGS